MAKQIQILASAVKTVKVRASRAKAKNAPVVTPAVDATPAQEAAQPVQVEAAPVVIVKKIGFRIVGSRPTAGAALFAHTQVFMSTTGMLTGAAVPSALVKAVMGDTAVAWHTKECNMEQTRDGLKLTESGLVKFQARKANPELVAAFEQVLIEGKPHDAVLKNPVFIKAI